MLTIDQAPHIRSRSAAAPSWLFSCALTIGTLDLLAAMAWWALRDVAPIRILQAVAGWVLGREQALAGGAATAVFGAALQYTIMLMIAAGYYAASQRFPLMLREPLRWGALYGACAFVIQHVILIPSFVAGAGPFQFDAWTLSCIVVYVFLVGIPCALFAHKASRR